jgi:hypothetical protein
MAQATDRKTRRIAWERLVQMLRGNNDQCSLKELLQLTGVVEKQYRRLSDPTLNPPAPKKR